MRHTHGRKFRELLSSACDGDREALRLLDEMLDDHSASLSNYHLFVIASTTWEKNRTDNRPNLPAIYLRARALSKMDGNEAKALKLYRFLIKQGYADAFARVGEFFAESLSLKSALFYYMEGIRLKSTIAMRHLALLYLTTKHPRDYRKAILLFREAHSLGDDLESHLDEIESIRTTDTFVIYHIMMILRNPNTIPDELYGLLLMDEKTTIQLLLNDKFLSKPDRYRFLKFLIEKQNSAPIPDLDMQLFILDQIPEDDDYYPTALETKIDLLFNELEFNHIENAQLPAVLYTIESAYRTLLERHRLKLCCAFHELPDKKIPVASELNDLIRCINRVLQQNAPIANLMPNTRLGDNWKPNWLEARKHLLLYVERRKKIEEKYGNKLLESLCGMDREIKTTRWQTSRMSTLWRHVLPPSMQKIAAILGTINFRGYSTSLQDLLYAGTQIYQLLSDFKSQRGDNWQVSVFYSRNLREFQQMSWEPYELKLHIRNK